MIDLAYLVLDYLEVLATWPVVFLVVGGIVLVWFQDDLKELMQRIAKITLPGGAELSTSQGDPVRAEAEVKPPPEPDPASLETGLPDGLTSQQRDMVEQLLRSHISTARLWEYRYLNYFLARSSQTVLDWFSGLNEPIALALIDSVWLPLIPSANERHAVITALQAHHLIQNVDGLIAITPKGKEYQEWRGPLPAVGAGAGEKA